MSVQIHPIYRFGQFELDVYQRLLMRQGQLVPISPKVFELLLILIQRQGTVVEKSELMQLLWPDTYVEENNLTVTMSALRKALGDGKEGAKYIETIPRRGYRFFAGVSDRNSNPESNPSSDQTVSLADNQAAGLSQSSGYFGQNIVNGEQLAAIAVAPTDSTAMQTTQSVNSPIAKEPEQGNGIQAAFPAMLFFSRYGYPTIVIVLLTIVASVYFARMNTRSAASREIRSIAVLPFKQLTPEPQDDSLGLGLADALITRLSNTGRIIVRPTSAIVGYSKPDQDLMVAARDLEVDALLDGRVQRDGNRIRITVQFLRASDGKTIWGESFDEQFTNILAVQNTISEKVARALTLRLTEPEQKLLTKRYTDNAEAFELYLKGRYFWNKKTAEGLGKAIELLRQAINLDPDFALAYAGIADCYVALGTPQVLLGGQKDEKFWSEAKAAAQKALELDPMLAEAHASLGAAIAGRDDAAAHQEFEKAIQLNPNYSSAYHFYAIDLIGDGRLNDALQYISKGRELDPVSVSINGTYGMLFCRLRRPSEAIQQFKKTLELEPTHIRSHWGMGLAYEQLGRYEEAIEEHRLALKASNGGIVALASLGRAYALAGRRGEAQKTLELMLEKQSKGESHPYYLAALYIALDDKDKAFELLEKNRGSYPLGLMKSDQFFDSVRDDSRYAALFK